MPRVSESVSISLLPPPPSALNAITDVAGVLYREKITAAGAVLNGYGKSIGLVQIEELGPVETPILLTSTLNVARVTDALITCMLDQDAAIGVNETVNPVVLEWLPNFGFPGDLVIAGDAPLAATDLPRIAWRCFLGMARTGAISGQTSGDLAVAFSTNPRQERQDRTVMNGLFRAAADASEEAILNGLFTAQRTEGRDGHVMPALPIDQVLRILQRHGVPARGHGQ